MPGGVRRALCDFVGVDSSIVATVIAGFVFVGLWVMALVSLVKSDGQVPDKPGRKNKPRRRKQKSPASARRRASRPRKKDRAKLLPADEAYYLYRVGDSLDYGQEAMEILLQVMENDRDKLVVILAGYKDRIDEFFTSNPGMSSRDAHHVDFAAYELDELTPLAG
jgi:hypothetical protein